MPNYRTHGKIQTLLTDEEFKKRMDTGHFVRKIHRSFCILLFYTGIRRGEALRVKKEQFKIEGSFLVFDVKARLKSGVETAPLILPLAAPFMKELVATIEESKSQKPIFQFCSRTAYNIVDRVFYYPHHFRLNRITKFFLDGFTIPQVRSWSGHKTLKGLEAYIGIVNVKKMGESLAEKPRVKG